VDKKEQVAACARRDMSIEIKRRDSYKDGVQTVTESARKRVKAPERRTEGLREESGTKSDGCVHEKRLARD